MSSYSKGQIFIYETFYSFLKMLVAVTENESVLKMSCLPRSKSNLSSSITITLLGDKSKGLWGLWHVSV